MKRKAQSEVITTFALILIVLAAIGIVWYIVDKFIWNKSPFTCSDVVLKINEARSNTAPTGRNQVEIQRKAGGEGIVKSVKIIVNGNVATIQNVNGILCIDDDDGNLVADAPGIGDEIPECEEVDATTGRTALSLDQIETKTYEVGDIPPEAAINIAAVIETNGQEEVCNIVDRKNAA